MITAVQLDVFVALRLTKTTSEMMISCLLLVDELIVYNKMMTENENTLLESGFLCFPAHAISFIGILLTF